MIEERLEHTSTYNIAGLIGFRSVLAGLIEQEEKRLEQRYIDVGKIDAALKVIDPTIDLTSIKPKRPKSPRHSLGATVFILDTLRCADHPLTARDLAVKLVEARGHSTDDTTIVEKVVQQVGNALQNLRKQGTVDAAKVSIGPQVWRLTD